MINAETSIQEILELPIFHDYGRLLFPINRILDRNMTLQDLSSSNIYWWYSYIQVHKTVEILQTLYENALNYPVFYPIYSQEEMREDVSKQDTGLFWFKGHDRAPYAICSAGGGFAYVAALHDSFPHALEIHKKGYHAFVLIYRVDHPYDDLGQAIQFVYEHAELFKVDRNHYSLWGGSAGARMSARLGNKKELSTFVGKKIPQAKAVIMQYTGYSQVSPYDAPTYACVGSGDYIADDRVMKERLRLLEQFHIPTEFHCYERLPHGFGLGTNTIAEGWIHNAIAFWESQMSK